MCQSYWLTKSEFERPASILTQKCDYTIGLIVLDSQNYTQKFI